jgi:catechol 2,3-dioxygenase-like lactoylglutathione lyase family enzyme
MNSIESLQQVGGEQVERPFGKKFSVGARRRHPRYDHAMTERWANSTIFFVRDAGAAAAFYADTLGFTVNWRHDEGRPHVGGRDQSRRLRPAAALAAAGQGRKGVIYLAFGAAEYEVLRADLQAKGVALKDGWRGKRLMIVEDPDGNQLWIADPHDGE